ncbi:hypothetical protein ABT095_02335 [Kitasatospora sp. NPDC002227]|uniref:hypothetical protein n=1 Tax=Kitasatospora sp. NPDC002227 TaxID=3154773 RepID=UPI00331F394E
MNVKLGSVKAASVALLALAMAGAAVAPASAVPVSGAIPAHHGTPTLSVAFVHDGVWTGHYGMGYQLTVTNHTGAPYQHFAPSVGILGDGVTAANTVAYWDNNGSYLDVTTGSDGTVWTDPKPLDRPLADGQTITYNLTVSVPTVVAETYKSLDVTPQATADGRYVVGSTITIPGISS